MPLPKQIRDQIEEANRISKDLTGNVDELGDERKGEGENEGEGEGSQQQPVSASTPDDSKGDNPKEDNQEKKAKQDKQKESQQVKPEGSQDPARDDSYNEYEHRYKVLRGKYDSEVPRLQKRVGELEDLLARMAEKQAGGKDEPRPGQKPLTEEQRKYLTEEEIQDFGEDMVDMVGRRAREVYEPYIDKLSGQIEDLQRQLQQVNSQAAVSTQDRVFAMLDSKIENWQAVNEDERFLEWLEKEDEFSGAKRGMLLRDAFKKGDGLRVVRFFERFLQEYAPRRQQPEGAATQNRATLPMESMVAPGKSTNGSGDQRSAPEGKRNWTQAEVAAFYSDVRRGKFRKTPDRQKQIEKEILAAAAESRIIQ